MWKNLKVESKSVCTRPNNSTHFTHSAPNHMSIKGVGPLFVPWAIHKKDQEREESWRWESVRDQRQQEEKANYTGIEGEYSL